MFFLGVSFLSTACFSHGGEEQTTSSYAASIFSLGEVFCYSGVEVEASFGNYHFVVFFLGFLFLHMRKELLIWLMKKRHEKRSYLSFLCSI
jgi:hypothetical protein